MWCLEQELVYYCVCTVYAIYSIGIYSSANFGYIECSRSSVRYTCFFCAIHTIQLSVQCVLYRLCQILLSCS